MLIVLITNVNGSDNKCPGLELRSDGVAGEAQVGGCVSWRIM